MLYNIFFDKQYEIDKNRAKNIIRRLGERILTMENLESRKLEDLCIFENIECKRLIIKVLRHEFGL